MTLRQVRKFVTETYGNAKRPGEFSADRIDEFEASDATFPRPPTWVVV